LLLNGTSALFRPLVPRIVAIEHTNHVKNDLKWGPTGKGKTVCVENAVKDRRTVTRVPCGKTDWEFGGVIDCDDVILASDVSSDYMLVHRQSLLQLADRRLCTLNVKCGPIKAVAFMGQIIIVSNYQFPEDEALKRRFQVIYADVHAVQKAATFEDEPPW